jgi:hypothetical protein
MRSDTEPQLCPEIRGPLYDINIGYHRIEIEIPQCQFHLHHMIEKAVSKISILDHAYEKIIDGGILQWKPHRL